MQIMNGTLRYRNKDLMTAAVLIYFIVLISVTALNFNILPFAAAATAVCIVVMIVAGRFPCRYSADSEGITFKKGFSTRRFEYKDIRMVRFETQSGDYAGTRYHNYGHQLDHVLTIITADKKEHRYYQACGRMGFGAVSKYYSEELKPQNCELKKIADLIDERIPTARRR